MLITDLQIKIIHFFLFLFYYLLHCARYNGTFTKVRIFDKKMHIRKYTYLTIFEKIV